jgi:sugar/nucleoside kinase (ribokinase family)
MHDKIVISGTGCALADFLYSNVHFDSQVFSKYLSKLPGDGGLSPGKLVFTEEFEKFAGKPYAEVIKELTDNRVPDAMNIGGPGLVSQIHASQLLGNKDFEVKFYGSLGKDEIANTILNKVKNTPLNISNYQKIGQRASPFTDVLSDPQYDNGNGERTFVNNIGAAWDYLPSMIPEDFFRSQIVCFGGTALVPRIHDSLTFLLRKAKQSNCITVVNTVFDFRNEKANPSLPWPLGESDESFGLIDVLILDHEEALKISGQHTLESAIDFFIRKKVSSFIVTNGANDLTAYSNGSFFEKTSPVKYPVSRLVTNEIRKKGDTTGCGDNFVGGIIASIAQQRKIKENGHFDFTLALSLAIASGGFACSYLGGTFFEKYQGEKLEKIQEFYSDYRIQIGK